MEMASVDAHIVPYVTLQRLTERNEKLRQLKLKLEQRIEELKNSNSKLAQDKKDLQETILERNEYIRSIEAINRRQDRLIAKSMMNLVGIGNVPVAKCAGECGKRLPITSFYPKQNPSGRDGWSFHSYCIECRSVMRTRSARIRRQLKSPAEEDAHVKEMAAIMVDRMPQRLMKLIQDD